MGHKQQLDSTSAILDGLRADGRPFGHMTEGLRDSLLAGATKVSFGIAGLDPTKPSVAIRYIADDGCGMTYDVMRDIYAKLSASGTLKDFDITITETETGDVDLAVNVIDLTEPHFGDLHGRKGLGGRITTSTPNPFGVVTVTIANGIAHMMWGFRPVDSKDPELRNFTYPRRGYIVPPHVEPADLTADDLKADVPFWTNVFFRSGRPFNVSDLISEMELSGDTMPNPLDYDWMAMIPEWIADEWTVETDGSVHATLAGEPAHGTVKFLLGENPWHSTGYTGDQFFPVEALPWKYQAHLSQTILTLDFGVEVGTQTLVAAAVGDTEHAQFPILNGGPDAVVMSTFTQGKHKGETTDRFRVDGIAGIGTTVRGSVPLKRSGKGVTFERLIDIGEFGKAHIIVAEPDNEKGEMTTGWERTNRRGQVAYVYGLELHSVGSDAFPSESTYRNLGIPTINKFERRVSVYIYLPRATTEKAGGVMQTTARDGLKWKGIGENLPQTDIFKAIRENLPPEIEALALAGLALDEDAYKVDPKRYAEVMGLMKPGTVPPIKPPSAAATNGNGNNGNGSTPSGKVPAIIGDGTGTLPFDPTTSGGTPGTTERAACSLCGQKIHAPDCPLYRAVKRPGGSGGTGSAFPRGPEGGTDVGRTSKAHVTVTAGATPPPDQHQPPNPPHVIFCEIHDDVAADGTRIIPVDWSGDHRFPATWTPPGGQLGRPETGTVNVNWEHTYNQSLLKAGLAKGRNAIQTKMAVKKFLALKARDAVMGVLTQVEQPLHPVKRENAILDAEWFSAILGDEKAWAAIWSSSLFTDIKAVEQMVIADAAVKAGRKTTAKTKAVA